MSIQFFQAGREAGALSANANFQQILILDDSEKVGKLAGKCLNEARKKGKAFNPIVGTETWGTGFFEGFMERAEKIKKGDK